MPIRSILLLFCSLLVACDVAAHGDAPPPVHADVPAPPVEPARSERATGSARSSFPLASAGFPRGDEAAPLTVYEISDFGCRFCGVFTREEFPRLLRELVETGRVRWVFIPTDGVSANGSEAARAAVCAGEQERFWEMHDLLFHDQRAWMRPRDPEPVFTRHAAAIGLVIDRFSACYHGDAARARVQSASRLSLLIGVRATPTFFVDGRLVEGALRASQFSALIGRLEAAAREADGES